MSSRYKFYKSNGKSGLKHRLIAEKKIGRKLLHDEVVHHRNNDGRDNSLKNLVVMSDKTHRREMSPDGERKVLKCKVCGKRFTVLKSYYNWRKGNGMSVPMYDTRECAAKARRKRD